MSKPIKIVWKPFDEQAVCLPQTLAAAGNLKINGTEAALSSPVPYMEFVGLERTLSISSTGNLSGVNFTITGTLRGETVSAVVAGPNNETKEILQLFTKVTSVHANNAVLTDVSVGSGVTGQTIWLRSDYQRAVNNLTVGAHVVAGNITYTFETSIDDPITSNDSYVFAPVDGVTIPTIPAATAMKDATVSIFANYTWPTHSSRIKVTASNVTGSLIFFFLQQGQV